MTQITLSLPTFNTPQHLVQRMIRSLQNQTFGDFVCVVTNDGGREPWMPRGDDRFILYARKVNRGRYFSDQVVLQAAQTPFWKPVDDDDWVDFDHLSSLIEAIEEGPVMSSWYHHWREGAGQHRPVRLDKVRPGYITHFAFHCAALFPTEQLRAHGGPHPDMRLGDDTRLVNHAYQHMGAKVIDRPTYHRVKRKGSLMTTPATNMKSAARAKDRRLRAKVWHAWSVENPLPFVKPETAEALAVEIEKLKGML